MIIDRKVQSCKETRVTLAGLVYLFLFWHFHVGHGLQIKSASPKLQNSERSCFVESNLIRAGDMIQGIIFHSSDEPLSPALLSDTLLTIVWLFSTRNEVSHWYSQEGCFHADSGLVHLPVCFFLFSVLWKSTELWGQQDETLTKGLNLVPSKIWCRKSD